MNAISKESIKEIETELSDFLLEMEVEFKRARSKITDENDLLKFDGAKRNVVNGFTVAMNALISLAPLVEKYGIE